jgi:hypothetical protein
VAVIYEDNGGTIGSISSASNYADNYGWDGGWRITDNTSQTLWLAGDGSNWLFPSLPSVFIVNTITLEIVASEWDGFSVNVLTEVEAIDAAY